MPMLDRIVGGSILGNKSDAIILTKVADAIHRPNEQAIYEDEQHNKWYVKKVDEPFATQETLAADYFRFLTGKDLSPELRVLSVGDQCYVISQYNTNLLEITPDNIPKNIDYAIIASYVISDGDCKLENVKLCGESAFRIDFGGALHEKDPQNLNPFASAIGDLRINFDPLVVKKSGRFTPMQFINSARKMCSIKPDDYNWASWDSAAKKANIDLDEIKLSIQSRTRLLAARVTSEKRASEVKVEKFNPKSNLLEFYTLLEKEKEQNDFIIFPISPEELAREHCDFFEKQSKHLAIYLDRIAIAKQRIKLYEDAKAFIAIKQPSENEYKFIALSKSMNMEKELADHMTSKKSSQSLAPHAVLLGSSTVSKSDSTKQVDLQLLNSILVAYESKEDKEKKIITIVLPNDGSLSAKAKLKICDEFNLLIKNSDPKQASVAVFDATASTIRITNCSLKELLAVTNIAKPQKIDPLVRRQGMQGRQL